MACHNFVALFVIFKFVSLVYGLYPYESESREIKSLDGLWNFKISSDSNQKEGFKKQWYKSDFESDDTCIKMPVPASFNDITTDKAIRDYLGVAWYQKAFYVPKGWMKFGQRTFIHFGGVHFFSFVWLNDQYLGSNEGAHLPFSFEVSGAIKKGKNRLTLAVNNTLTPYTIPQGFVTYPNNTRRYPPGYRLYSHNFDYFDYAGINRPVTLYTTPKVYIDDIKTVSSIEGTTGLINYTVTHIPVKADAKCNVTLLNKKGELVTAYNFCSGVLHVQNATLWWPMNSDYNTVGYLYTLVVELSFDDEVDTYRLPVGIRTLKWDSKSLYINDKPIYLKGFGMHEDADIRGRGFDYATLTRDMNLIKWIGANAIRTSHYPYSEEFLNQADELGLLVILESPACSLSNFSTSLLNRHVDIMYKMIQHHKNRPSVIMWSLANEPLSNLEDAGPYFRFLKNEVKIFDETRPVTFVTSQSVENDKAVQYMDIICFNRYSSWYQDPGRSDLIWYQVMTELISWHDKFDKPVMMTEYGAGSIPGLHTLPESMWSEEYQVVTIEQHTSVFRNVIDFKFLIGEMIWNFIDFNTPQEYIRPGRCAKGLFTRNRQPKEAAYLVRKIYHNIRNV